MHRLHKYDVFARLASVAFLFLLLGIATPLSAQTVEAWQRAAVQRYPELAQQGSPLNQKFIALIAEKRKSDPAFFANAKWPVLAAEEAATALKAEQEATAAKTKADEEARLAKMSPDEQEWDKTKDKWVFERVAFGDTEETVANKLNHSKFITARVAPAMRATLDQRFQLRLGEAKFDMDFEMKPGMVAINFNSFPQKNDNLDGFIHDDWSKLREAAIEKFGPPTKTDPYPKGGKLFSGGWTVTDVWERPGSRIKLGLTEDGGKTAVSMRISDPAKAAN